MMKEILYTGFGGLLLFKERVEEEVSKLEEKGKLKKEDAEKFLDSLKKRAEDQETEIKAEIKKALKELIEEMDLATKSDIRELLGK